MFDRLGAGKISHADLQGARRRRAVPAERRVPHRALRQPAGLRRRLARRRRGDPAARPPSSARRCCTPLNRVGDKEGCKRHDDGSVTTPTGLQGRLSSRSSRAAGSASRRRPNSAARACRRSLTHDRQRIPVLGQHGLRHVSGPDPGRDRGAAARTASPEQKAAYLPKMIAGEWTGTMNLTEPHCGTDLGLLRTKAVKQADGSYKITGTKIFISAGEHDLRRQHHPSRAGAHRRRAGGHQGHLAVRRAEDSAQRRRLARRAQRRRPAARSKRRWASTAIRPA